MSIFSCHSGVCVCVCARCFRYALFRICGRVLYAWRSVAKCHHDNDDEQTKHIQTPHDRCDLSHFSFVMLSIHFELVGCSVAKKKQHNFPPFIQCCSQQTSQSHCALISSFPFILVVVGCARMFISNSSQSMLCYLLDLLGPSCILILISPYIRNVDFPMLGNCLKIIHQKKVIPTKWQYEMIQKR